MLPNSTALFKIVCVCVCIKFDFETHSKNKSINKTQSTSAFPINLDVALKFRARYSSVLLLDGGNGEPMALKPPC